MPRHSHPFHARHLSGSYAQIPLLQWPSGALSHAMYTGPAVSGEGAEQRGEVREFPLRIPLPFKGQATGCSQDLAG